MKVGIKAISELSGYSIATVSNVLNNKRSTNKETREKILRIAREIGYLDEGKLESVKLIVAKRHGQVVGDTPFFSALIDGIAATCREKGLAFEICNLDRTGADYGETRSRLLLDRTAGLLLLGTELLEEDAEPFTHCLAPILVLDSWHPRLPLSSVIINNTDSAQRAVEYLIEKGHRKIGYLKSSAVIQNFRERERGLARALEKFGVSRNPAWDVPLTPSMDGAYRDMKQYLRTRPALPTAFFADNDMLALGAMKALQEEGVRVPEDVSLIGFDDLPFCEISSPPLTTIKVDKQQMGRMAVRMLSDCVAQDGGAANFKLAVCTEFIERQSVRDLTAGNE